jgi:DNA-binding NtrC family response regulator
MPFAAKSTQVVVATRDQRLSANVVDAFTPLGARAPRVTQVASAQECLTALCLLNPALLVLDDAVTERPGPELVDDVHRLRPELRVVYVAQDHSLDLERAARRAGVLFYVAQPVDSESLESILLRILDRAERNAG